MDACLGDGTSVLENDRRTVEWLRNKTATIPHLNELFQTADDASRRFNATYGMNVYLKWSVLHKAGKGRMLGLHVGGLIQRNEGAIDNMSYYLCVSDEEQNGEQKRVLRKYHFDYANNRIRATRRSAAFHLQYAGKLPPDIGPAYQYEHMDARLDEPRIFFLPMSLSLVLHMAFREFPDQYTDRLCEDGEWQSVFVRRDQECLIVPYLQKCLTIATEGGNLLWDAACDVRVEQ